jgi:cytochrome c oxidase subunit 4
MANHSSSHAHGGHGPGQPLVGHLVPLSVLFATAFALIVLTVITVASHSVDFGEFNIAVALIIAGVKALLVGLYFMHLRWDRPFNQLIFIGSIIFVVLLMVFCIMDTGQYRAQLVEGNPKMVQDTLTKEAPNAPIAAEAARYR